jgi:hypothetical protein
VSENHGPMYSASVFAHHLGVLLVTRLAPRTLLNPGNSASTGSSPEASQREGGLYRSSHAAHKAAEHTFLSPPMSPQGNRGWQTRTSCSSTGPCTPRPPRGVNLDFTYVYIMKYTCEGLKACGLLSTGHPKIGRSSRRWLTTEGSRITPQRPAPTCLFAGHLGPEA